MGVGGGGGGGGGGQQYLIDLEKQILDKGYNQSKAEYIL